MKLSTAIHHYGAEALLYELFKVFPSNKKDLYKELQKLLNMPSGKGPKTLLKSFNKGELSLMIPANGETDCREFDVSLISKIIGVCQSIGYRCNNNQFMQPTGITFTAGSIPSLTNANSGDCVQLIKDLRNTILHAPAVTMKQTQFQAFWKFLLDMFKVIGYNAIDLEELEKASVISEKFKVALIKSLDDLEKQNDRHEFDIQQNKSSIDKHEVDIKNNKLSIDKHEVDIKDNMLSIDKHEFDIKVNKSSIEMHEADIKVNKSSIEMHEADIKDNKSDIEKHEVDIKDNKSSIEKHEVDIKDNKSGNEKHEVDIKDNKSSIEKHEVDIKENKSSIDRHEVDIKKHDADTLENKSNIRKLDLDLQSLKSQINRHDVDIQHMKRTKKDDQSISNNETHITWNVGKLTLKSNLEQRAETTISEEQFRNTVKPLYSRNYCFCFSKKVSAKQRGLL